MLHLRQVRILWEGLLIRQKAFQSEPGQYTLRGLVARRLVGKFSDTEKQAVGKQIFTSSDGNSFCMQKVSLLSLTVLQLIMMQIP